MLLKLNEPDTIMPTDRCIGLSRNPSVGHLVWLRLQPNAGNSILLCKSTSDSIVLTVLSFVRERLTVDPPVANAMRRRFRVNICRSVSVL